MSIGSSVTGFFEQILNPVKERLSSPLGSAFAVFWLAFNWHIIYYFLMSNDSVDHKITMIRTTMYSTCNGLIYPLVWAAGFCLLFPLLKNIANTIWSLSDNWSSQFSGFILKTSTRLTKEEQKQHLDLLEERTREHQKTVEGYEKEISELKNLLKKVDAIKNRDENKNGVLAELDQAKETSPDEIPSSELVQIIKSTDGSHRLKKYLAQQLLLNVDNQIHKRELQRYEAIIELLAKEHPHGWVVADIKTSNSQNTSIHAVKADIEKMSMAGIAEIDDSREKSKAFLSQDTVNFIVNSKAQ
ncbi:hypothetical protein J6J08_03635 [Pseudidiomarina sp. 1APR75-33.1]|uniref:hypothetical protein n=1 Tax=Pseudidiomarina terrestris TaxID=2820060 RepID=UPI00264BC455|nr:hypothetical protein [Pseudidiomarina sp. 1APR75-33.1]MDN7126468.1 hypothetical protein [Pseudidiomarina sp. 1APR75-33.1]